MHDSPSSSDQEQNSSLGDSRSERDFEHLSVEQICRVNELCNQFENDWRAGQSPKIEDYLSDHSGPFRTALLWELLVLEIDYRRFEDKVPSVEYYLQRFPELERGALQQALADEPRTAIISDSRLKQPAMPDGLRPVDLRLTPGAVFAGYELLEELGRGGMGVVFKARHQVLDRVVALKLIRSGELASEDEFQRFQLEIKVAGRLDHADIVPIYEVGEDQGLPYFTMKYVEGGSLLKALRGGVWCPDEQNSPRRAAGLLETIARAIDHAHRRGILHRDLKPANILLGGEGHPLVSDFGLAKHVGVTLSSTDRNGLGGNNPMARPDHLTATGVVLGTPCYMSPEQASGQSSRLTVATDVYSLGAILYELLTGQPPFRGESPLETIQQVLEKEPLPPTRLVPHVPPDLEVICLRCLQKQPDHRYASAAELAEDLKRFRQGESIQARPTPPWRQTLRWVRRHPVTSSLAAALFVVVLGALVFVTTAFVAASQALRAKDDALTEKTTALTEKSQALEDKHAALEAKTLALHEKGQALQAAKEANWKATTSLVQLYAERLDGIWEKMSASDGIDLTRVNRLLKSCPRASRGLEYSLTHRTYDLLLPQRFSLGPAYQSIGGTVMAASCNGDWLAYATPTKSEVRLRNLSSKTVEVIQILSTPQNTKNRLLSFLKLGKPQSDLVTSLAMDPTGKFLACGLGSGTIHILESQQRGWELKKSFPGHQGAVKHITFGRQGSILISVGFDKVIHVWDVSSSKLRCSNVEKARERNIGSVYCVALSPDGKKLAWADRQNVICVVDITTKKLITTFSRHNQPVKGIQFDNNSQLLTSVDSGGVVFRWHSQNSRRYVATKLAHGTRPSCIDFHPSGRYLVCGDKEGWVRIHHLNGSIFTGSKTKPTVGQAKLMTGLVLNVHYTHKGNRIVAKDLAGNVVVWNPAANRHGEPLPRSVSRVQDLQFHPRRPLLAVASTPGREGQVEIWDVQNQTLKIQFPVGDKTLFGLAYDPTGQYLVTSGNHLQLWKITDKAAKLVRKFSKVKNCLAFAFSPNGKYLALAGNSSEDFQVATEWLMVWDLSRNCHILEEKLHQRVLTIGFSRDGDWLCSGDLDGQATFRQFPNGKQRYDFRLNAKHRITSMAVNPTAKNQIALAQSGGAVWIVDLSSGKPQKPTQFTRHGGNQIKDLAFSRDGARLVWRSDGGRSQVWDFLTRQKTLGLNAYAKHRTNQMAISPDNCWLAEYGYTRKSRKIYIWRIDNPTE